MQLLRNKILRFIRQKQLFSPGDTVVAAVSGGADSVALLDVLLNLPGFRIELVVAHLNHDLRGAESDGDEEFVRGVADRLQLPFETSRVDVAQLAAEKRLSLEEAGRHARYAFFARVAEKYNAAAIALAHHKDDQAETVLMRLLRGSAGSGLAGIRPKTRDNRVVRPLLCASRREIEAYLGSREIVWREDSSNSAPDFLRNRIRHQLLPLLHDYNPEVVERLNATAEALANDEALLDTLTHEALKRCTVPTGSGTTLDLDLMQNEPDAIRSRLYRQVIRTVKGDLRRISFRHLESIERLVSCNAPNGQLDLPNGITVVRSYRSLAFSAGKPLQRFDDFELSISACGIYRLPCGKILHVESEAAVPAGFETTGKDTVFLDPARFPFPWQVRYFKPGDRIVPLGMSGHKKLKELFIDRKIPLSERYRTPLLLQDAEVVWICGRQLSEKGRLAGGERPVLRVRMAYTAV
jgi:tRNA(Ile)-lysidine synthase